MHVVTRFCMLKTTSDQISFGNHSMYDNDVINRQKIRLTCGEIMLNKGLSKVLIAIANLY